jgi:hypothetical protein
VKLWLALLLGVVIAGCGSAARQPVTRTPTPGAVSVLDGPPPKAGTAAATLALQQAAERRRLAALARARRSTTVEGALRAARLSGRISPAMEARLRRQWSDANATLNRLTGVRKSELGYMVGVLRSLAASHQLTSERLEPTFLILYRNTRYWPKRPLPASRATTTFGKDPAIFRYYSGHGWQLQQLTSWGRANAMAGACLNALRTRTKKDRCRISAVTKALDRMSELSVTRNGFTAFEYYFEFGGGAPPWVSGMVQATAIQALSRGYRALGITRWKRTAERALGAFEQAPPSGVSVPAPEGRDYLQYSFAPGLRILNADLQAMIGLHDGAALLHSERAERLFKRGEAAARRRVSEFDTGAWSLYSEHGSESTYDYHVLLQGFLAGLCKRTNAKVYCRTSNAFKRYEREPTRIAITPLRNLSADRTSTVRFSLSKVSDVKVRVWGTRGMSLSRDLKLPRGSHTLSWHPPGRGRFKLRIEAKGPSGPTGIESRTIKIKLPKPKPKPKAKKKKKAAPHERSKGTRQRDAAGAASRRQP